MCVNSIAFFHLRERGWRHDELNIYNLFMNTFFFVPQIQKCALNKGFKTISRAWPQDQLVRQRLRKASKAWYAEKKKKKPEAAVVSPVKLTFTNKA